MVRAWSLLFLGLTACNAQVAQVLTSEDSGTPPLDAGPTANDVGGNKPDDAGVTVSDASDQDGGPAPGGVCTTDQDCNDDQTVSALWGTCFQGQCFCNGGNSIQPSGKCHPGNPPACTTNGGTCRQMPAECQSGEMQGSYWATMTCGDIVPVACCYEKSKCTAFVDFVCCGASTTPYEPVCVNGWKTCDPGAPTPKLRTAGCQ